LNQELNIKLQHYYELSDWAIIVMKYMNLAGSTPESGAQSSSSLKVAVSPPDYFQQRPNQNRASSSNSSGSLFFSSGTNLHG